MKRTKEIQEFIIDHISDHKQDIGRFTADHFGLSRPAVTNHIQALVKHGILNATGKTKARIYDLKLLVSQTFRIKVTSALEEDIVWREKISPLLGDIRENIRDICNFGFTEMLNNVKDHSRSESVELGVVINAAEIILKVRDIGIGVFNKLMQDFNLHDPRHALLELSKGKLTSDKTKHSGQGIFFTSRMFDEFVLDSDGFAFCRINKTDDWLFETSEKIKGTSVTMKISQRAPQTASSIMHEYSSELHDYGFTKTHIPLTLARYEGEQLVSRSQAKRLLQRVDQFKEVLLDFRGVTTIGQAFADEIFRVYKKAHPSVIILAVNKNEEIDKMIKSAQQEEIEGQDQTLSLFDDQISSDNSS